MPKLLVVGSCGTSLPALHSKIAQLTGISHCSYSRFSPLHVTAVPASHGFTCCFCVGEFFPPDDGATAGWIILSWLLCFLSPSPSSPEASVSETHLDADAPSLDQLLPNDFDVPVYFICGERCDSHMHADAVHCACVY
jgi:hypothetical protein